MEQEIMWEEITLNLNEIWDNLYTSEQYQYWWEWNLNMSKSEYTDF